MKRHSILWTLLSTIVAVSGAELRAKDDVTAALFTGPLPRVQIEIPAEGMTTLRAYNQVWRQKRPERIDVRVTVRDGLRIYTNVALHLKGSYSFQPIDGKPSMTLNFDGNNAEGEWSMPGDGSKVSGKRN